MIEVQVNNDQVKAFSKQLRKMHRSNFPLAVRGTLNDLAFDVKNLTLMQSAERQFILRVPNFIKRFSGVSKADGFNVNSMKSEVGIIAGSSIAAKGLKEQELGGRLKRPAIYVDPSRVAGSKKKRVKKQHYLKRPIVTGTPNKRRSDKSQFVADAIVAKEKNMMLLKDQTLFDIRDIKFGRGRNRKVFVRLTPIASYMKGRVVAIKQIGFIRKAATKTYQKVNEIFINNAKRRFERGKR